MQLPQVDQYITVPSTKVPVHSIKDRGHWLRLKIAEECRLEGWLLGFVLSHEDPYFCLDIDDCISESGEVSSVAQELMALLQGCYVEKSVSGRGLHIIGKTNTDPRTLQSLRKKRKDPKLELYTYDRYIALARIDAEGDAEYDATEAFEALAEKYFKPLEASTDVHSLEIVGSGDVALDEVVRRGLRERPRSGKAVTFGDLWKANDERLALSYPPAKDSRSNWPYDGSSADLALARRLIFYGADTPQDVLALMLQSGLNRQYNGGPQPKKWEPDRSPYLKRTINKAFRDQTERYQPGMSDDALQKALVEANAWGCTLEPVEGDQGGPVEGWQGETDDEALIAQMRSEGRGRRNEISTHNLLEGDVVALLKHFPSSAEGKIDYPAAWATFMTRLAKRTGFDEARVQRLCERSKLPSQDIDLPELVRKVVRRLRPSEQAQHLRCFEGCTLVTKPASLVLPNGEELNAEQTNVAFSQYGPFPVTLTNSGETKYADKAWSFLMCAKPPYSFRRRAEGVAYDTMRVNGEIFEDEDGRVKVNAISPITRVSKKGDISPFQLHMEKLFPDERDRAIVWNYCCALVQYRGRKAPWAPVIQGGNGNGKGFLISALAYAVGAARTEIISADTLLSRFNGFIAGKNLIAVPELVCPEMHTGIERLKAMLTDEWIALERKGQDIIKIRNQANFFMTTNYKDALRVKDDRRFALFYTPQQTEEDLVRDEMDTDYFARLWKWAQEQEGYAYVAHAMEHETIPDAMSPFSGLLRAPKTSAEDEAKIHRRGTIESEILEAIESGRPGFREKFISSWAIEQYLKEKKIDGRLPRRRYTAVMKELGYIPHPRLMNHRMSQKIAEEGNIRPRIYIHEDAEVPGNLDPSDIAKQYMKAQGYDL